MYQILQSKFESSSLTVYYGKHSSQIVNFRHTENRSFIDGGREREGGGVRQSLTFTSCLFETESTKFSKLRVFRR